MKDVEFNALVRRLEQASDALQNHGCLLQSLARRYYLVYTYAVQAGEKHGIVFRRGSETDESRHASHRSLPNVVRALYSANNSGPVVGGGPGITRTGRLSDADAYRYTNLLQKDRIYADYGYADVVEPYDARIYNERRGWAQRLVEDLRTLL